MTTKTTTRTTSTDLALGRGAAPGSRAALALAVALAVSAGAWPGLRAAEDAAAAEPSAALAEARGVVRAALARYEAARSYRLDFEQETFWALADSTTVVRGTLVYRRPGSVAVRYEDGSRIVVTGDSMRLYTAQTAQFFVGGIDSSDVALDPPRLLRAYEPDPRFPFAEADRRTDGLRVVNLKPGPLYGEPARVLATIDAGTDALTQLTAVATSGDRTTYRILASRFDVNVSDGDFVLRRPPGATLMKGSPF